METQISLVVAVEPRRELRELPALPASIEFPVLDIPLPVGIGPTEQIIPMHVIRHCILINTAGLIGINLTPNLPDLILILLQAILIEHFADFPQLEYPLILNKPFGYIGKQIEIGLDTLPLHLQVRALFSDELLQAVDEGVLAEGGLRGEQEVDYGLGV
jgi:hypothetical protein